MADMTIFPTGLTYSRNTKAPLEDKKLFDTLVLAYEYINNPDQTAYVGLTLSVTNDPDPKNNGLYYVAQIAEGEVTEGILEKVGSGNGSQALEDFTVGEDGKIAEATADNIGQVIYIKTGTEEYPAGPYIVTGVGTVSSMTTAPAGEDIGTAVSALQGDVATVKSDVQDLQSKDEELASADAALGERIDAVVESVNDKASQSDLEVLSGKVDANEGEITNIKSDAEALEGRVEASEGEITNIKSAAEALEGRVATAEEDITDLKSTVASLATATHFIGVKDSLESVTDPKEGDIVIVSNKEYIYSDGEWIELGDTTAEANRILELETKSEVVDQELINIKSAAEALEGRVEASEGEITNIKSELTQKAAQSDFEELSGRVEASEGEITNIKSDAEALEGRVEASEGSIAALAEEDGKINSRIDEVASDVVTLGNDLKSYKVKDVDTTAASGVSLSMTDAGVVKVGVDVETLANEIIAKHVVDSEDIKLGANIGTDATPDRYTTEDTVQGVLASMNTRIESIDADIQSALEGGVTGIEQGNGIVVDSTTATKPKVSVKVAETKSGLSLTASGLAVSVVEGSAIVATDNGLDLQWSQF